LARAGKTRPLQLRPRRLTCNHGCAVQRDAADAAATPNGGGACGRSGSGKQWLVRAHLASPARYWRGCSPGACFRTHEMRRPIMNDGPRRSSIGSTVQPPWGKRAPVLMSEQLPRLAPPRTLALRRPDQAAPLQFGPCCLAISHIIAVPRVAAEAAAALVSNTLAAGQAGHRLRCHVTAPSSRPFKAHADQSRRLAAKKRAVTFAATPLGWCPSAPQPELRPQIAVALVQHIAHTAPPNTARSE
jgi:hypothetical protein